MGWYGTYETPNAANIRAEFERQYTTTYPDGTVRTVTDVRATQYGRNLWGILRENGEPRLIIHWMVQKFPNRERPEWLYKPLAEDMGPVEIDCPLELLDKCPCPGGRYAEDWRERVRAHHAKRRADVQRAKSITPGATIRLIDGLKVPASTGTVLEANRGRIVASLNGWRYRIPAKYIAEVLPA